MKNKIRWACFTVLMLLSFFLLRDVACVKKNTENSFTETKYETINQIPSKKEIVEDVVDEEDEGNEEFGWVPSDGTVDKTILVEVFYDNERIFDGNLFLKKIKYDELMTKKHPSSYSTSGIGIMCFSGDGGGMSAGFSVAYGMPYTYSFKISYNKNGKKLGSQTLVVPIHIEGEQMIQLNKNASVRFFVTNK